MANDLSTADIEMGMNELSNTLINSEWNDEVKNSYFRFIEEQRQLISNIKWMTDRANSIYNNVISVDIGKFKSTYSECMSKFEQLQRGN